MPSYWKGRIDQLICKPSTTELCIKPIPEHLVEPALVMVVSMLARIIHATNVHHDITRGESTRISCPDEACRARSTDPPTRTDQFQNKGRGVKVYMERQIGIQT